MLRVTWISACVALFAACAVAPPAARAGLIVANAVFAHDFETVSGPTVTALVGPDATITPTMYIVPSTVDPKAGSTQHISPQYTGNTHGNFYVNTNTRLTAATNSLSYSIFYNDRGDNGGDWVNSVDNAILLASTDYSDASPDVWFAETKYGTGQRALSFEYSPANQPWIRARSTLAIPEQDNTWHQAGFVFQGGVTDGQVTFYFDGQQWGDVVTLPGVTQIAALGAPWTLIEDYEPFQSASGDDFFDSGFYDEAALWTRGLSAGEMQRLYQQGITATPEPSTFAALAGLLLTGLVCLRRRKKDAATK